ncbi:MAG: ABC transporter ATP-binding protein [Leptolyngbyaceae cyanobacterium MO_188.B28]|nr:ABC transporter ATP-binding protein [Leptolyngbyaceae cyanobacterium MO_188.B28]
MSDIIIRVEDLGKKYLIRHEQAGKKYKALRDVLTDGAKSLVRPFQNTKSQNRREEFWALKDVSFEIKQGDRVGVIGRNGAGKSTLLKILSRITEPTTGRIRIKGRVASLLEVGTGFHPELTGRENIFLNGAILGMSREEIKCKFDEIVAFAEIEQFLDTPVKRYSSGMYVRLAFAVAAHLEPEILIVDEVLAVGDAAFQKKCLGKMRDVSDEGRTVLFVSHNMGMLQELSEKSIWLDRGEVAYKGDVRESVSKYLSSGQVFNDAVVDLGDHPNRLGGMKRILDSVSVRAIEGEAQRNFIQSEDILLYVDYKAPKDIRLAGAGFIISTLEGIRVGSFNTYMAFPPPHSIPTKGRVRFIIPARQFTPGSYVVTVSLGSHQGTLADKVENCINFMIDQSDVYGTGYLLTKEDGVVTLSVKAEVSKV